GIVASFGALGVAIGICLGTMALAIAFGVITLPALAGLSLVVGFLAEAALLVSLSVFALLVSQAVVSFLGGKLLLDRMEAPWAKGRVATLLVGLVIFVLITTIPILGGI